MSSPPTALAPLTAESGPSAEAAPFAEPLPTQAPAMRHALVVFSGRSELWWLRGLKPGFRHCFALLYDGRRWLLYDPMSHVTQVRVLAHSPAVSPAAALLARGYVVVPTRPRAVRPRPAPWAPFTCVEAVKRVLGIHARGILTPWQLFRYLTADTTPGQEKKLDIGIMSRYT